MATKAPECTSPAFGGKIDLIGRLKSIKERVVQA